MLKVGSISTLASKGRVLGLFCSLLYCCGQHNAQHVVALDNYLLSEWVNEWVSKRDMLCVHSSSMVSGVTEQALCALALTVLSSQSWTKAFIKAVSLKHIYCHSFTAASTQVSDLLLSFLPPLEPSRSKSVNLEVDEDKSTKRSHSHPHPPAPTQKWPLVCLLTPFPKRGLSMFLKMKTLSGRVCAWLDRCTPVCWALQWDLTICQFSSLIREAWSTSSHHWITIQSCRAHQRKQTESYLENQPTEFWFPKKPLKQCRKSKLSI